MQDNSTTNTSQYVNPATRVLYPISRRTSANSSFARHLPAPGEHDLPLCRASRQRVFSWEWELGVPTCTDCLAQARQESGAK